MSNTALPQNLVAHKWYDDNAEAFANADAIEGSFVGMTEASQERLNRFKLHAIDEQCLLDDRRVLEFGAGHGRLALAYPRMAFYRGIDYSKNLVELGTRRLAAAGLAQRAKLEHGEVLSYMESGSYDVVCSLGMMCYFQDPTLPVRKMVSLLRPGGQLFFDFRVDSWLYSPVRKAKWALNPPTGGVAYMLRANTIRELLVSLGLIDVRIISREFPLLAGRYARRNSEWPLKLRNRFANSVWARSLATEAWVFARKPNA